MGVSQSVISRVWNRYLITGNFHRRHAGGILRITRQQYWYLVVQSHRNQFSTATQLRNELQTPTLLHVSTQTVRNRLHEVHLRARSPAVCVSLSPRHSAARLAWACAHLHWTWQQWAQVWFTDESKYRVDNNNGHRRVWRLTGERYHQANIVEHDQFGG
jgi:hypothetical protein